MNPSQHLLFTVSLICVTAALPARAAFVTERSFASPDGKLTFTLERDDSNNRFHWSVNREGAEIVTRGALGIDITNVGTIADEGSISQVETRAVNTAWSPPFGERSLIPDRFREETLTLNHAGHGDLTVQLQVRAYDEGIAFRYLVNGAGTLVMNGERTSYPMPGSAVVWTSSSAQGTISKVAITSMENGRERPLTAELAPNLFVALGEAGSFSHARMKFSRTGSSTLIPTLGGSSTFTDSLVTPWRYVRAAASPGDLHHGNHLLLNLSEPSRLTDASWLRPGKVLREVTLTTAGGIAATDWAAAHGIDFIHFDAGWYGNEYDSASDATTVTVDPARSPGPLDLQAVIAHANTKNIGVILYVNRRALETQLDDILPLYQQWGVAGIKFGFVNTGSQHWTKWLHESIEKCAEHRLMVDVHDEYRMMGIERTLPNFMTAEGVRGDETSPSNEMVLRTIFTRCLAGASDHTNCYFAPRVPTMGSHGSQLAKAVCIYSPWQYLFWYDRPPDAPGVGGAGSVIQDVPELSFFTRLPTVWDETRWLDGHPETHATVARRKGQTWFVGALNGSTARSFNVPLDFLTEDQNYRLEVFQDDATIPTPSKVRIDTSVIDRGHVIDLTIGVRNGFSAILTPTDDPVTPPPPAPPPASSMTFRQGADIVSNDKLFEIPAYEGVSDTSLLQEFPDDNYGARDTLLVGVLGSGKVRTGLLRHDLSSIAGKYHSIRSLKLRLRVDSIADPNASMVMKVALQRAGNASWTAGTNDGQTQTGAATWKHANNPGTSWLGGASGARSALDVHGDVGSVAINNSTAPVGSWVEVPLTPIPNDPEADTLTKIVDLWTRDAGADNGGLLLAYTYPTLVGSPEWRFSSSDHSDPTVRPELIVEFVPKDAYGIWAENTGLLAAGFAAADLDPDHDGLPNLLECLFGGDPLAADDNQKLPTARLENGFFVLRHRLSPIGAHLDYVVETATNLVDWQPAVEGSAGIIIQPGPVEADDVPTVEVSIPQDESGPRFFRVRARRLNDSSVSWTEAQSFPSPVSSDLPNRPVFL